MKTAGMATVLPYAAWVACGEYKVRVERNVPVLAIHNVYHPVVPAWSTNAYAEMARSTGADKLFVQRWSTHGGHCNVKPEQHQHAFEDLLKWQATGVRPEAGEQK